MKTLSKADKLTTLFDQDWKTQRSTIRTRHDNSRTYDVIYSWDAKSDNPIPNSRLEQTLVPEQTCKPIVLSGKAVIELENTIGFDAINVKPQRNGGVAHVPLSQEQQDLNMRKDLTGYIPNIDDKQENSIPLVKQPKSFKLNKVNAPEIITVEKPDYMVQAGT